MDNIRKLIVGGCSFTAGNELHDWNGRQHTTGIIRPRSNATWANALQKSMFPNATLDNTAISGSGYGSTVRRVIFQTNKMLKIYNPSEIVVCIMWTSILRLEFPTIYPPGKIIQDDEDKFIHTLPSDGDSSTPMNRGALKERKKSLADEYLVRTVVEFYTRRATADNHIYYPLQQLEYLTSWLQARGVKFYYTTAFNDLISLEHHNKNIYYDDMKNRLDLKNLIHLESNQGFWEYAKTNNYECGKEADHPLEPAHLKWAELFEKWILTKQ